jgi:hypothetical protein
MLEMFFIVCLEIALLAVGALYVSNSLKNGMLNDSVAVRHKKRKELLKMPSIDQDPPSQELTKAIAPAPVAQEYL